MVHHKGRPISRFFKSSGSLVASLALLVSVVAPAAPVSANWAGAEGSIIYKKTISTTAGSSIEYHAVNPDGSNDKKLNLTFPAGLTGVSELKFNNDGSKFAFMASKNGNTNLYVANASDGKNAKQLTDSDANKSDIMWTSNGLWLLWAESPSNDYTAVVIKRVSSAGGEHLPVPISLPSGFQQIDNATLSPNDQVIAFNAEDTANSYRGDVFTVPAAGGVATNITNTTNLTEYVYDYGRESSKIFIYNGSSYGLVNPDGSAFVPITTADLTGANIQWNNYIILSPLTDERALSFSKVLATDNTYKIHIISNTNVNEVPYLFFDGNQGISGQVLGWTSVNLSGLTVNSTSKLPNTGVAQNMTSSIGLYGAIAAVAGLILLASKRRIFKPRFMQR